ncbi:MAG TPA: hypothetical protein DCO77_03460 [Nitrospiraceae bacterium]|nr:hypothetical protein [Nitrospiraceae bacterium]
MLYDLFLHLTTPCSTHVRRMGYLDEAIAMRRRFRRNRASWKPHLDNSCRFVLSAAEQCRNKCKAVILGSGLLLDVPLAELAVMFQEVVLMDVVCLLEVRRRINRHDNIRFVEHDVTNVAQSLYQNGRDRLPELPEPAPATTEIDENTGLVVSLNILSQLWVVPRTYAVRHFRGFTNDQVEEWCRRIVESHYAALRSLRCDVCLVADHEFVKRDGEGQVASRASSIYDILLPEPDASWTWNILPIGKDSPHLSKELIVGAWHMHP